LIGGTFSHYEILDRLAGGAAGAFYKARDLTGDRLVAIQVVRAEGTRGEERQRLLARAEAASALGNSHICAVYETGETADGELYVTVAFCEGESLGERLARGPLPIDLAIDLATQIAEGLAAAHGNGIVHGDLHPGSVVVDAGCRATIVDFGLSPVAAQDSWAAYRAPEQLRGEPADARADVWALGVLLYQMVTARLPFDGEAAFGGDPPPMSGLRAGVPADLEWIVAAALAKRPEERYADAGKVLSELAQVEGTIAPRGLGTTLVEIPSRPSGQGAGHGAGQDAGAEPAASRAPARRPPAMSGRVVAHYRILDPLGTGGMGIVYRAVDTKLGRTVALKFLPPELTRDAKAKERFLQEARAASALDHPNVCTIHEVGETADGQLYLAMAGYDGETLAQRLRRGPLPVPEAVALARQIAQGLTKAHQKGIVHRDVKPANVMITGDGIVKILDFGIAKLAGAAAGSRAGFAVGTPAYMSPEQARGEDVDGRTDVWSLGVVLFEMVAGQRPFRSGDQQAAIDALLHDEPKMLAEVLPEAPPELARIVGRMVVKPPDERYPTMAAVLSDLTALESAISGPPPERRGLQLLGLGVLGLAVLAVVVGLLLSRASPPVHVQVTRLTDQEGSESFPSLSPDGGSFVYTKADDAGASHIFLQKIGGSPLDLSGTGGGSDIEPAFSPDGRSIVFRSERDGGGIFLLDVSGGRPGAVRRITPFACYNPAWSPDGRQILCATEEVADRPWRRSSVSQLWRVEVANGARRLVSAGDAVQPSWSPSGRRVAYWGLLGRGSARVLWTMPAGGGPATRVTYDAFTNWNPVWSPDGRYLYYASDRSGSMNLWRVPIDEASGRVRGEPEPIATPSQSSGLLSVSRDGRRILYATNDGRSHLERMAFDPESGEVSGPRAPVIEGAKLVRSAEVSPDGRAIVFDVSAPQEDLFLARPDGTDVRQLTHDLFKDRVPRWTADGSRILFYSNRSGRFDIWSIRPDGTGLEQVTRTQGALTIAPIASPDGRRLVCGRDFRSAAAVVDLGRPLDQRIPRPLPPAGWHGETFAANSWSPDGALLAGSVSRADGTTLPGVVLYAWKTGSYERLSDRGEIAYWLHDSRRLLVLIDGKIYLLDTRTRQSRPVLAPPPHSTFSVLSVGPDDRTLYAVRVSDEGDIWMATLN